ncbi:MAG TPA: bifunctional phosphopantothenoylcysteine decarboxylase/phosphopantothenate--cysteine ligase CoaBC [Clostridiales bacterium]|nr:bifunctional phosphopantothenoylcysteine decarboxylase/phosphopantothenate--cysteine ligase CoaBC [Clostridiales bacterium]
MAGFQEILPGASSREGAFKSPELAGKRVVLGVTSSIAAYKAAEVASRLVKQGCDVHVVLSANAVRFITPLTFETLTQNRVYTHMFEDEDHTRVTHIHLATTSDLILVCPATYNIIGKAASGIADDLLSSILAAAPAEKVMFAPAMHTNMYSNPILKENIRRLKASGCHFIPPGEGLLACGAMGRGRLREPDEILEEVEQFFCEKPLKGKRVLITAGATREYIDPIRFLSNSSSGTMGISLARACRNLGAEVTLILANSPLEADGIHLVRVETVTQMLEAVMEAYAESDLVFAAAAVSDFKPVSVSSQKIKKDQGPLKLEFALNTDILYSMGMQKNRQILVGFAAESAHDGTEGVLERAREKLKKKNLDAIIANELSNFNTADGKVWVVTAKDTRFLDIKPKQELAYQILEALFHTGKSDAEKSDAP